MAVQLAVARVRGEAGLPSVKVLIGGRLVERRSVRRHKQAVAPDGKGGNP
jgi:hypothetical protein